jgi:serine/threonine protein kinase
MDWIWGNGGQLQVIKTRFWPGRHYALRLSEFFPIIEDLQDLHKNGFVHGDIRGFNIIFCENNGKLIDFDFGGRVGVANYPGGYKFSLTDGTRVEPLDGTHQIRKWHDWYALGHVFLSYHKILHPDGLSMEQVGSMRLALERLERDHTSMSSDEDALVFSMTLISMLKKWDDTGFACQPTEVYRFAMKDAKVFATESLPRKDPLREIGTY